jgi:hypothetical protein
MYWEADVMALPTTAELQEQAIDFAKCMFMESSTNLTELDLAMIQTGVIAGMHVTLLAVQKENYERENPPE